MNSNLNVFSPQDLVGGSFVKKLQLVKVESRQFQLLFFHDSLDVLRLVDILIDLFGLAFIVVFQAENRTLIDDIALNTDDNDDKGNDI